MMVNFFLFGCFLEENAVNAFLLLTNDMKRYIYKANGETLGFETIQKTEEECLKSKMTEAYNLSITMTVCQIEKWRKYIRCWFPTLYLYLNLKLVKIRITITLKREVV